MLATDHALPELALPRFDARVLARRAAIPGLLAAAAVGAVIAAGGAARVFADALRRTLHARPGWALLGVALECVSLVGYIGLLWLVAGRAAPRIGMRESAQITLTGAGATRLLPTAGAGGAAVTIWALRRAGLNAATALRTLLVFFVLLYAVFLAATAVFGAALSFGLVGTHGPAAISAVASAAAALAFGICLALARAALVPRDDGTGGASRPLARLRAGVQLIGLAVLDACEFVRARDVRLAGAVAYWACDAAVLWAMLSAFGSPPPLPVVGLAYFLGQVANTLPIPGSVSGGIAGVLIAWGVPVGLALPAVLTYRTISAWLPAPAALGAIPGLRATLARWSRADAPAA